jgi:tetratricopeptide (TPR) repeat protein
MLVALVVAAFQLRRWRAGAAAMIAVTITSFGDDPLHKPPVLAMIALLFAALPRGRSLGRKFALSSVPPALVAMASLAILLVPALRAWRSDRLVTRAEMAAPFERQAILERAAAIDRGSPDALLALGLARFDAGDLDGAATVLARARSLDDDAATSIALGNVEAARDDLVSAETAFRHAIERSPGNFRAHVDLAEILRRQGRLEDARHVARVARALRPWDVAIVDLEERLSEDAAGG